MHASGHAPTVARSQNGTVRLRGGMRSSVLALVLFFAHPVAAQPMTHEVHAAALGDGVARIETEWSEVRRLRTSRVTARLGEGPTVELHAGATVRTAVASAADQLCVVAFHGGDEAPFARAILAHREGDHVVVDHTSEIPRALAIADGRPRFPAGALVTATPRGFAVMVQHQERDPTRNVVTTLTVLGPDGSEVDATHVVAVPWALGALVRDGDGYQLAVLFGGSGHEGTACFCLVHLDDTGRPTEHPWWASPFLPVGAGQLLRRADGSTLLAWLDASGEHVVGSRWTTRGGWAVPPAPPQPLFDVPPGAVAWTLVERAGELAFLVAQ